MTMMDFPVTKHLYACEMRYLDELGNLLNALFDAEGELVSINVSKTVESLPPWGRYLVVYRCHKEIFVEERT